MLNEVTTKSDLDLPPTIPPTAFEQIDIPALIKEINALTAGKNLDYDEKLKTKRQHLDVVTKRQRLDQKQRWLLEERVHAYGSARHQLDTVAVQERNLNYDVPAQMLLPVKTLAELEFAYDERKRAQHMMSEKGVINKQFIAISPLDAYISAVGCLMVLQREGLDPGQRVLDLGAGDGQWSFVWDQLGFQVTGIERDPILAAVEFERKVRQLAQFGVSITHTRMLNEEFNMVLDKNTPQVMAALAESDIWICYPWQNEVNDRLTLFETTAKPGAILLFYGSATINGREFILTKKTFVEHERLELVGQEVNDFADTCESNDELRGYDAAMYGAEYLVVRKKMNQP